MGGCVTVRWWDLRELMGYKGTPASSEAIVLIYSILGAIALVKWETIRLLTKNIS